MANHRKQVNPMLVDESLNWAFAVKYFIYALFGLAGAISSIPAIALLAGDAVATTVGSIIALAAAVASFSTLRASHNKVAKMLEFYSTVILVVFIMVYIFALSYLAIQGDHDRIAVAVIASGLVVLPCWKLSWIIRKNRLIK